MSACECNQDGSEGLDCNEKGTCICKPHFSGEKCDQCAEGYEEFPKCDSCKDTFFGYPNCTDCSCFAKGSKSLSCNQDTGICDCLENYTGEKCDTCAETYWGFPTCERNTIRI